MRFELFRDVAGKWRWRLVGRNGEIMCSSEGYSRRIDAEATINSIRTGAMKARVIEVE
jgi:uncharacterized protein YegP (UPF0339 family)